MAAWGFRRRATKESGPPPARKVSSDAQPGVAMNDVLAAPIERSPAAGESVESRSPAEVVPVDTPAADKLGAPVPLLADEQPEQSPTSTGSLAPAENLSEVISSPSAHPLNAATVDVDDPSSVTPAVNALGTASTDCGDGSSAPAPQNGKMFHVKQSVSADPASAEGRDPMFHVKQSAVEPENDHEGEQNDEPDPITETPQATPASDTFDATTPLAREIADMTRRRRVLANTDLPLPETTRVITVSNQKGGVGKTTTTVNLAAALARSGARVLVIDLDPQGNASTALGIDHRSSVASVYDVVVGDDPMGDVIQKSPEFDHLYCVPATIHLAGAEIELVSMVAREQRLRRALDAHLATMDEPFHYVFIDCPPSLGLLTINAFVAAREVLIPIQCEYYALEGLSQLLTNIELIEKHLNPTLHVSTILLTMFDSRTNLAHQVAQEVRDHFPAQTLAAVIPRSVRVSEAPSYGQSVISYDMSSSGSLSYLEAATEIAIRGAATESTQPRTEGYTA